jgi:CubicO group peptidase (beta-lactamase class C family)
MHRIAQRKPIHRLLSLVVATILFGSGCALMKQNQSGDASAAARTRAIVRAGEAANGFMRRHQVQGLSMAVVDSRGLIWSGGFGRADKQKGRGFNENTKSLPGSVSKLLTTTAVMILVDRGMVDLDAPAVRYIPDLAIRTDGWPIETITVRSLLTHHSGLPSDRFKGMVTDVPRKSDAETASALPSLLVDDFAARRPDTAYAYSNMGFSLLGTLVERVSKQTFAEFVRQEIFEPLGMADSTFHFGEPERLEAARGYRGGREELVPYLRDTGAGGLLTTARDMGRFLSAMLAIHEGKPGILRPETLASMWTRQNGKIAEDLDFSIGLGWWLGPFDSLPGEKVVAHGGDWLPFVSLAMILPERNLGIFIMANSLDGSGSMTLEDLALSTERSFAASERGVELSVTPAITTSRKIPTALQSAVTGDWTSMMGLVRIRQANGGLRVNFAGKWFDCVLRSDGRLGFEARLLGIKLPVAELDEYSISAETMNGQGVLGFRCHGILVSACQRVQDGPVDAAWKALVGAWQIPASDANGLVQEVKLKMEETGRLLLSYRFFGNPTPREYPIETISPSRARLMGSGRGLGESLVVEGEGSGQRLVWSGFHMTR